MCVSIEPDDTFPSSTYGESLLYNIPELLGKNIARMLDCQVSTLVGNLLSGKRTLCVSPARGGPPLLDGSNFILELLLFGVEGRRHVW
jgi:hypothetical protein